MKKINPANLRNLEAQARAIGKTNGAREDMVKVLEEMLSRFKTGRMDDFPGGVDASN